MSVYWPRKLALVGGACLVTSGVLNFILGVRAGAVWYDVYPGGNMGHVGMVAGIAAVVIGLIVMFGVVRLYVQHNRLIVAVGGIMTVVLGHLGAIAGALYIGTAGMLCCYVAGIWTLVIAVKR